MRSPQKALSLVPRKAVSLVHKGFDSDEKKREALFAQMKSVVCDFLPAFDQVKDTLTVDVVQGGVTNLLFKISSAESAVLVRIYGENTEFVIDREEDCAFFAFLAERGLGPKLLGLFDNGRLEEFIDSRSLEPRELPLFHELIAKKLADFHAIEVGGKPDTTPVFTSRMSSWLQMAEKIFTEGLENPSDQKVLEEYDLSKVKEVLSKFIKLLESKTKGDLDAGRTFMLETVFSHNDVHGGNLLLPESEEETRNDLVFIDNEYCGFNPRAFDIANHFCEHTGFDFWSLKKNFPSKEQQQKFMRAYLNACQSNGSLKAEVTDDFLEECRNCVNEFVDVSHALWGVWSVVQAKHSPIDFDFLDYGKSRMVYL